VISVAHDEKPDHARQFLEHDLEEPPAVDRRTQVAHVGREDAIEVLQQLAPAPDGDQPMLLPLPHAIAALGGKRLPHRVLAAEREQHGHPPISRGLRQARRVELAQPHRLRPALAGEIERGPGQRGLRLASGVGQDAAVVEEGHGNQAATKEPAPDEHEGKHTRHLVAVPGLQVGHLVAVAAADHRSPGAEVRHRGGGVLLDEAVPRLVRTLENFDHAGNLAQVGCQARPPPKHCAGPGLRYRRRNRFATPRRVLAHTGRFAP
jgi:hypothetical protein